MDVLKAAAFIDKLPDLQSAAEVGRALMSAIGPSGYIASAAGLAQDTPHGRNWSFFYNTWPKEWLREYQERDYVRHDPAPTLARLASEPFTWLDVAGERGRSKGESEFLDWFRRLGIADGFIVPIHLPGGDLGLCVSIANRPIVEPSERLALHVASLYAHARCREWGPALDASSGRFPLSPREIECLRWVLRGKSDRDIAGILDISHTTVKFHVERVKKKLDVKTRAQAVATLVGLGYL
jgi:DNA-binding CsgD family transcriptional regulator